MELRPDCMGLTLQDPAGPYCMSRLGQQPFVRLHDTPIVYDWLKDFGRLCDIQRWGKLPLSLPSFKSSVHRIMLTKCARRATKLTKGELQGYEPLLVPP